jgi:membrane protein
MAATGGKITLGLVAALWSASVGFAAIQEGMNTVYKVRESRPLLDGAWLSDSGDRWLLSVLVTLNARRAAAERLTWQRLVPTSIIWHHCAGVYRRRALLRIAHHGLSGGERDW